jgi:putative transposase
VNGRWERCISERYAVFQGRTERELTLATAALRQQKRLDRHQLDINAKTLAAFLASVEGQEVVLTQQLQDHAAQHVRTSIFGRSEGVAPEAWQSALAQPALASPARPTVTLNELEQYGDLTL